MIIYDIYGFETDNFDEVLSAIKKTIGGEFELRESYYMGGRYYCLGENPEEENFIIQRNFNIIEKEWEEEEFQHLKILFYVNNTDRADKLRTSLMNTIKGIALVRRKKIVEDPDFKNIQESEGGEIYSQVSA